MRAKENMGQKKNNLRVWIISLFFSPNLFPGIF
jgi:hypothetical protein